MPLISALILNYRSPQQTVECVRALQSQTVADNLEIIVIDNHSEDDSIGVIRNRLGHVPNLRIIETPLNRGFGGGYAAGAKHAKGTYVLINNPDKKLNNDALEKMVRRMEEDASIGILAPKLMHGDATVRHSARAFPRPLDVVIKRTFLRRYFPQSLRHYLQLDHPTDTERDVDWVVGGCLLIRKDFFEEIGGFDPRYFLFFEDIDLCRTCRQKGKRVVYFPAAIATDRKRRLSEMSVSAMLLRKTGRAHIASAVRYFWKWGIVSR